MIGKRPPIGITTSKKSGRTLWVFSWLAVFLAGGRPVKLMPGSEKRMSTCDGFLITGGSDINPDLYGHKNTGSHFLDHPRDQLELSVVKHASAENKPLLGICRGAQMINVARSGTLHQNARDIYEGFQPTESLLAKVFSRRFIEVEPATLVARAFKGDLRPRVNSLHRQSVQTLGRGLQVSARDALGMVQALESEPGQGQFVLGVQWHPELILYRPSSLRMFRALVRAAQNT
ncbi:gamma-glutamyl-gamma-aminobutyrate hydrolase family protein [Pseudovibrio exalbescens]|uniref:gamma-glutamyl-gamma-aminobutyrate hydrolase family protein n=1 Tax=Pseudovibrio exalbescens TaxID=197461 RepID=UPI002366668F|nr:gamma-glutamyl-gamma-aminobutyrate hydrolase family protein [Pseudovibrio exalbescens]MDD7908943.1 gamma-glutamyl-gamma-aminobutyrate hydrolase family protein [Pseudovibrio exalbescens]